VKTLGKALIVAALHLAIVLSLGGKLLYDRAHRPRIWVRTGTIDPDLPIRGRYLTLSLEVHAPGLAGFNEGKNKYAMQDVRLEVENGQLTAHPSDPGTGMYLANWGRPRSAPAGSDVYILSPGVTFFLPEHAHVPILKSGEELWAEVTVPRKGPPRPIQLALKKGTQWIPLNYR
jgi:hypothetical protein